MDDKPVDTEAAPAVASARRGVLVVTAWLVVAFVAAAAFGAAFAYSGGTQGVLELLRAVVAGDRGGAIAVLPRHTGPMAASASSESSVSGDLGGLPASALRRMYSAQIESQLSISALVSNRYSSLTIGTPQVASDAATVPLTVHLRGGGSAQGLMTLERFHGLWYVFGLQGTSKDAGNDGTSDPGYDPAVVSVITSQQATQENQDAFDSGVLGGGFTKLSVRGVTKGVGTASVDVAFSGGTSKPRLGRFVCITKHDSTTDYWFIARLAAN